MTIVVEWLVNHSIQTIENKREEKLAGRWTCIRIIHTHRIIYAMSGTTSECKQAASKLVWTHKLSKRRLMRGLDKYAGRATEREMKREIQTEWASNDADSFRFGLVGGGGRLWCSSSSFTDERTGFSASVRVLNSPLVDVASFMGTFTYFRLFDSTSDNRY